MANIYSVALSYKNTLGWIDYDEDAHTATVKMMNPEAQKLVEDYLHEKHVIKVPHKTLMDFTDVEVDPLADKDSLQLALTRLWNNTQVHVDWSRPVDYVKAHPTY